MRCSGDGASTPACWQGRPRSERDLVLPLLPRERSRGPLHLLDMRKGAAVVVGEELLLAGPIPRLADSGEGACPTPPWLADSEDAAAAAAVALPPWQGRLRCPSLVATATAGRRAQWRPPLPDVRRCGTLRPSRERYWSAPTRARQRSLDKTQVMVDLLPPRSTVAEGTRAPSRSPERCVGALPGGA